MTLGKIEYIEGRDLRIVTDLTWGCEDLVKHVQLNDTPYTICESCVETLHYEASLEEVMQVAEACDVTLDDVLDDPTSFGVWNASIIPDLFMADSEPDLCSGCEAPFEDGEAIIVLTMVDLLDAEPVAVERHHYDTTTTFLCQDCALYALDSE